MIEMLLLVNCRLFRCSVLVAMLMLVKFKLCRCSAVIEMLMLVKYRLRRCTTLIGMLLLANYRLCRCSVVIENLGVGLLLECYYLLIIGCVVCCLVIGILLLKRFGLFWCNALTSVCYHYSSLTLSWRRPLSYRNQFAPQINGLVSIW